MCLCLRPEISYSATGLATVDSLDRLHYQTASDTGRTKRLPARLVSDAIEWSEVLWRESVYQNCTQL